MKKAATEPPYTLFGTSACHLCDVAEEMLDDLRRAGLGFAFQKVDISTSNALFERYGVRIPVLRGPRGREMDWPFSAVRLREFVGECSPN